MSFPRKEVGKMGFLVFGVTIIVLGIIAMVKPHSYHA